MTTDSDLVLQELFKDKHYADLEGGILEGFGRLLKFDLKVWTLVNALRGCCRGVN